LPKLLIVCRADNTRVIAWYDREIIEYTGDRGTGESKIGRMWKGNCGKTVILPVIPVI
jgi:hypothetical protein